NFTGPYSPRGVDNDDPNATQGYFIGVDGGFFSLLQIRRILNPGGTPAITGNLSITVPTTVNPINVTQPGSPTPAAIDASDDRLFQAALHKNTLTGATTLWTAQHFEVNASGVGTTGGGRDGARWYEIANLSTTPSLNQSGTLFDSSASPVYYFYPTV